FARRIGSRSRPLSAGAGTSARREVRLEAARKVDDLRLPGRHGRNDSVVDNDGGDEERTGRSAGGWFDDETGAEEDERGADRGARQIRGGRPCGARDDD